MAAIAVLGALKYLHISPSALYGCAMGAVGAVVVGILAHVKAINIIVEEAEELKALARTSNEAPSLEENFNRICEALEANEHLAYAKYTIGDKEEVRFFSLTENQLEMAKNEKNVEINELAVIDKAREYIIQHRANLSREQGERYSAACLKRVEESRDMKYREHFGVARLVGMRYFGTALSPPA